MIWRIAGVIIAVLLVVLAVLTSREFFDRKLTVAVSTEEPAPMVAEAMRPFMNDMSFTWEIRPYNDVGEMVDAVQDGTVDFAIMAEPILPIPGVRTLAPLYPSILHVMHKADREPASVKELIAGQKIYAGPQGSVARGALTRLAKEFGVPDADFEILENPWSVEPDVYFIVGGLLADDEILSMSEYRLFGFGDPSALGAGTVAEGFALKYRNVKPFILPKGLYPGISDGPVLTIAIRTILIANADLPEPRAYFIAQALFENAQEIAAVYPLVTEALNPSFDPMTLTLPIHPGARLYIDRDEPGFLERYAETFAFGLTAIAGFASLTIWARRQRLQRRKDRVDVYYARILALRADALGDHSTGELKSFRQSVVDVQQEVFALLIDERIEADTAFTVFLGLSNQVLNELDARLSA